MSHIIKNTNDLNKLENIIIKLRNNNINKDIIVELMEILIPKDENNKSLSYYAFKKFVKTAVYDPNYSIILLSEEKIKNWADKVLPSISPFNENCDEEDLKNYLYLFVLSHEVEHAIQHLIAKRKILTPYPIIQKGYSDLFKILTKNNNVLVNPVSEFKKNISYILYYLDPYNYVFERNANIEAIDLIYKLASYEGNTEVMNLFNKLKNLYLALGYKGKYNGAFELTYKKLLMHNKCKDLTIDDNIPDLEKIRYGLPVKKEVKGKILSLKK